MMEKHEVRIVPSIYFTNYVNQFEDIIKSYSTVRKYKKGDFLTNYGVVNNTAFYIKSGIFQLSLGHEQGKKSLCLFGEGCIYPIGVEIHQYRAEFEIMLQAITDLEVYAMPYPTLKKMVQEHGELAGELFKENCDFIGYIFMDTINQTFEPCLSRICDILYLYLTKVKLVDGDIIPLTQSELASIGGVSQAQMERTIRFLKEKNILSTSRKQIHILDKEKMIQYCTLSMWENIQENRS